jgi:CDP-glycerol glycerophosphotransferase
MTRIAYNSFHGRFSDNPRAIYEELASRGGELEHLWTSREAEPDSFPAGVIKSAPGTERHRDDVAAADYIVANVEMREDLRKRDGIVFLQTWHGTPLKKIGYDNNWVKANPAGFERDVREYERWDYLISPNPLSTRIFREEDAFRGFAGEIIETGYPRNDALNAPDRYRVRAEVRERLGLEDGRTVVLYAPTWRDNLFHTEGPDSFSLTLDLEAMAERLGDDHAFLLRTHFLVGASVAESAGEAAINVSDYPDIRELYLAADVLITDYSSAMFDFAITGKPMVFFTYDLEHYRDEMRGFYFDFEAQAPGPLCRTTDEVIAVLADRDGSLAPFADRYRAFAAEYCALEDGRASARVVDRVFAEVLR